MLILLSHGHSSSLFDDLNMIMCRFECELYGFLRVMSQKSFYDVVEVEAHCVFHHFALKFIEVERTAFTAAY